MKKLDLTGILDDSAAHGGEKPCAYSDIRVENSCNTTLTGSDREITDTGCQNIWGASIRSLVAGSWGKTATSHPENIGEALAKSKMLAKAAGGGNAGLAPVRAVSGVFDLTVNKSPEIVRLSEKTRLLAEYAKYCTSFSWISSVRIMYSDSIWSRRFVSTEGADIVQHGALATIWTRMFARDREGNLLSMSTSIGGSSSFEACENRHEDLKELAVKLKDLTCSNPLSRGLSARMDVLLDPYMSGLFIHEAFGHMSEADHIVNNRALRETMKIGRKAGASCLSVVDDPGIPGKCGSYRYDDEGVEGRKTVLIDKGYIAGRLHSRETAAALEEEPTGNARAVSWKFAPMVRMSNIYAVPGSGSLEKLLKQLDNGLYVMKNRAGQTTGGIFTFSPQIGYVVKNGQICEPVRGVNLSGNLFELLSGVEAAGSDIRFTDGGACGKGEQYPLPCGKGGCSLLIRRVRVGG